MTPKSESKWVKKDKYGEIILPAQNIQQNFNNKNSLILA
jgi:hypothetical protein